jgi:hypothetical protein
MLGFVKRNLKRCPKPIKSVAYKSLVKPKLEYAAAVWDPYHKNQIYNVEMVQRRAARFVTSNYQREASVTDMLQKLKWPTLEVRRLQYRLVMMYRVVNGLIAIPAVQYLIPVTRVTRHTHNLAFQRQTCNSSFYMNSFFPRTTAQWNDLPGDVVAASSLEAFKARLQGMDLEYLKR